MSHNRMTITNCHPIDDCIYSHHYTDHNITMSTWMGSLFGTRRTTQESARDAIVGLRQQLLMLEKKEEHLAKKIEDELKKARANATTNKRCALA